MKRRVIAMILCLLLLAACAVAETAGTKVLRLGTSAYTIEIPDSFVEAELTEEDITDDMVAYMESPDSLMDFDIYQFSKEGYPETLAEFVAAEGDDYLAYEIVTDAQINGIAVAWYRAEEIYEDQKYVTITYALEDGDEYVEITFWLDGETAEEEAQAIINTLARVTD